MTKQLLLILLVLVSNIGIAQSRYDKLWEDVEKLELEGKFQSASEIIDNIYTRAKRNGEAAQLLKSFIYRSKFLLILEEEAQKKVIDELEMAISESEFPVDAILNSVYAGMLEQYLANSNYRIRSRSETLDSIVDADFNSWDATTLVARISGLYEISLKNSNDLKEVPLSDFEAILTESKSSSVYRPTLYDLLMHRALNFHRVDRWYVNRPKERFFLTDPVLFAESDIFQNAQITTPDSTYSLLPAIKLYRDLERFHKDKDTLAFLDVLLGRLNFIRDNSPLQDNQKYYLKTLHNTWDIYKDHEASGLIGHAIAKALYDQTTIPNAKNKATLRNVRLEAHQMCSEVIKKFPNSEGGLMCKILLNKIEQQDISVEMEHYILPENPFLAKVTHRNIDSLYATIYKDIKTNFTGIDRSSRDSLFMKLISEEEPLYHRAFQIQPQRDFYEYSTEIGLPRLPVGNHLILLSKVRRITRPDEILAFQVAQASDLVMLSTTEDREMVVRIISRSDGLPVENATVEVTEDEDRISFGKTKEDGKFIIPRKKNESFDAEMTIPLRNDTLKYDNYWIPSWNDEWNNEDEHRAKMFLFLDRSIYRPGQKVYFKGILIERKKDKSRVVADTWVTVMIQDVNGEELKEFRLKTNEFGSVQGSYELPRNVLTGEFTISMDEDFNMEGKDDPYWYRVDDFDYAEIEFSVEEYKRPRFEVQFDSVTENLVLGDTVRVGGKAEAYLGASIQNAPVKYTVTRTSNSRFDWDYRYRAEQVIKTGSAITNDKGEFELNFLAFPDSTIQARNKPVFNYTVHAEITDVNGETRSSQTNVRVGYQNLELDLTVPSEWNRNNNNRITILAENLNDQPIAAYVDAQIYRLKPPGRVLREKPWSIPDFQTLSKSDFLEQFPHEVYDSTDLKENWPKAEQVFTWSEEINGSREIDFSNLTDWEVGRYQLEILAIDAKQDTVQVSRQFEIKDPKTSSIPDGTLFEYQLMNSAYKQDGYIHLKFSTQADELTFYIDGYYEGERIMSQTISMRQGDYFLKVPVEQGYKDGVTFNVYLVKYNSLFSRQFAVYFPEIEHRLAIETLSLRNKLIPDQPESWRFRIMDSDNNGASAEVLAAMYDTSLDQFKEHEWEKNISMQNYGYGSHAPSLNSFNSFGTRSFIQYNYYQPLDVLPFLKDYRQLNWFGMDFGNTEYWNRLYLQNLKNQIQTVGQTASREGNITGFVTDAQGYPLPGVNVVVSGTTNGTQTDFDGYYSLDAPIGSVLIFSYIGFASEAVPVRKSSSINLSLSEDAQALDEVVVTGLGIQREKRALGYAVEYLGAESVEADITQKLQGNAAGVMITHVANSPGASQQVLIRGMASADADKRPLFVVDGVIVPLDDNEIQLNPEDIEDIEVLKGASATALYGTQAINGVVIITTKNALSEALQVDARSDLKETAFFLPQLRTDADGSVEIEFNSPQALTKWRFMLFAHTQDLQLGEIEKSVITQKDLSIIPNYPRFFREKDTLFYSVKVSNLTSETLSGLSAIEVLDAVTMANVNHQVIEGSPSRNFQLGPNASEELTWKLTIPEGLGAIQIKTIATSGQKSDGEVKIIPVLSDRILVTESKPIWVQPGKTKSVTLDNLVNNESKSLSNHRFTLEYTSNPAWMALKSLPYLMEFPYECAEQTFARYYSNAIAESILEQNPKIEEVFKGWASGAIEESPLQSNDELKSIIVSETPWLRDAKNEQQNTARLAKFFEKEDVQDKQAEAIAKLKQLQLPSGGFPWFSGGEENDYVTRHIVAGIGHLDKLGIDSENSYRETPILKKAVEYLDGRFISEHKRRMSQVKDTTKVDLTRSAVHFLYARSFFLESLPTSQELGDILKLYLNECKDQWLTRSLYEKGMIALIQFRYGEKQLSKDIVEALSEQAVQSEENGMYWKENRSGWYWYQAPIETQALLIEAFSEIVNDKEQIDQLKLWLLKNKRTQSWESTKATTEAVYALLMQGSSWLSVAENTRITVGDQIIEPGKDKTIGKEAGTGYMKRSWVQEEIEPKMGEIMVENRGEVSGFGGIYWQYFEDLDRIKKTDNGPLEIKKGIYLKSRTTDGTQLQPLDKLSKSKVGDLLTVRLEITANEDLEFIHLKDLLGSGLEPLDVLSEYKWQDGLGYYQATKDVATHFFFEQLPKGTYVFEYDLRINNAGDFSTGISNIQSMYAPEFSGHSEGRRMTVSKN